MANSKPQVSNRWKRVVVQILATPGYVLMSLGCLAVINTILYVFAVKSGAVVYTGPYIIPEPTGPILVVSSADAILMLIFSGVLWYFIGRMIHRFIVAVAHRFANPAAAHMVITFTGAIFGWAGVVLGLTILGLAQVLTTAAIIACLITLASFVFQQVTARLLKISLVD